MTTANSRMKIGLAGISAVVLVLGLASAMAEPAAAQTAPDTCSASIQRTNGFHWEGTGIGYSDTAPALWQEAQIGVRVTEGDCTLSLVVDTFGRSLNGPGDNLDFTLSSGVRGNDLGRQAANPNSSPLTAMASKDGSVNFALYLNIEPNQTVRAGAYQTMVPVRLYSIRQGQATLLDETTVDVSTTVEPELSVSADGFTGNRANVNFADISQGFQYGTDVSVRSNAPVSVRLESTNHGVLKHEQSDFGLPYRTFFNGEQFNLSTGVAETWLSLPVGQTEEIPLRLEADPMTTPLAGGYADTLTLIFRAD